jgi:hypothetical protein
VKVLETYDDLAWARSQAKLLATAAYRVTVEVRDPNTGKLLRPEQAFTIELAEGNAQDVDKYLGELADAGHVVRPPPKPKTTRVRRHSNTYYRDLREWCVRENVRSRTDPERYAYESPGGSNNYPDWLCEMYDAALASG